MRYVRQDMPRTRAPLLDKPVSCGAHSVIDAVFGPVCDGETTYAARLLGSLRAGMLLIGRPELRLRSAGRPGQAD